MTELILTGHSVVMVTDTELRQLTQLIVDQVHIAVHHPVIYFQLPKLTVLGTACQLL